MASFTKDQDHIPVATVVSVGGGSAPPSTAPLPTLQNEGGAKEFLFPQHWPNALQDNFIQNVAKTPLRFFIVDDSGSMQSSDGKRVAVVNGVKRFVSCSRWAELTEAMKFHVEFAQAALAPTEFRLLNGATPLRVGFSEADRGNVNILMEAFKQGPAGGTPLCRHIREIISEIQAVEHQLRAAGQKAVVIICTDGESSDGNVAEALRPIKNLPAWVVLRLCTDDDKVVDYWNGVDAELELNMDVLDDLAGEAREVMKFNSWLSYCEPLHRMREFGVSLKEFDLLDESLMSLEHMRKVCKFVYGNEVDALPLAELEFENYLRGLE
eukprot:gene43754-53506_t